MILGLDLAKTTGWAVLTMGGDLEACGEIRIRQRVDEDPRDGLGEWLEEVRRIVNGYNPVAIGYESPGFHGRARSQVWIRRQEGALLALCYDRRLMVDGIHVQTVKAHARATSMPDDHEGTPTKGDMVEAAIKRGWLQGDEVAASRIDNLADACWVADALRCDERLEV